MKRKFATVYAILCTLLMAAGFALVFWRALSAGTVETVACVCGIFLGFVFAPTLHELGHLTIGKSVGFRCVYYKAFCFKLQRKRGKLRFGFASPFAPDQTQMLPKSSGNMYDRAKIYTLGGLLFSGVFLALDVIVALWAKNFVAWGVLPYTAYLFFLNIPCVEYASGKTDALIYRGINKGCEVEQCMLSAMEIQGFLAEGKSFGEIDKGLYFDVPQLCEEEPLFAVFQDLRYRYYLDVGRLALAADALTRLAQAQAYLSDEEVESVAAELTYMHAIEGNIDDAEESGKLCKKFLSEDTATAKRILAAYSACAGKTEAVAALKESAYALIGREWIAGVAKFEKNLLDRMKTE